MNVFPKWLIALFIMVIAALAAYYFSSILICILLAGVLSLINKPVFDFFRKIKLGKYHLPNSAAALLTIGSLFLLFAAVFALIIPLVMQQVRVISNIDLNNVLNDLREPIAQLELLLHRYNIIESDTQSLKDFLQLHLAKIVSLIDIPAVLQSIFQTAGNFFFIFFSTLFILFFFLKEEHLFLRIVSLFTPDKQEQKLEETFQKVREMLFRYFMAVLVQLTCITVYVSLLLHFFGVQNALLIGLLAGLLNIIPYIGPAIGLAVALVLGTLAHLQTGMYEEIYWLLIKIAGVFISMQLLDNNLLQPYLFSKSTNAHPLEIFIVIVAAGTVSGMGGMIIAVPAYTIVRIIVFEFFGETKFIRKISGKS
jgi:predicted PurR-regulated permease PerM